jgi:hypothetical protein
MVGLVNERNQPIEDGMWVASAPSQQQLRATTTHTHAA